MSERLHYFNEATTPVMFDCSDSDIDSDVDDSRLPLSPSDRAKQHALQLQLWSDEARRRRRCTLPSSRGASCDRQQSNLSSDRNRRSSPSAVSHSIASAAVFPGSTAQSNGANNSASAKNVGRSHSAKNLRIRVTPSSSSRSLLSDVSELALPPSLAASACNTTSQRLSNPTSCNAVPCSLPSTSPQNLGLNPLALRRASSSASSAKWVSGNSAPSSNSRLMMTPLPVQQYPASSPPRQRPTQVAGSSSPVSISSSPVLQSVVLSTPVKTDAIIGSDTDQAFNRMASPVVAFDSPAKRSESSAGVSRYSNNPLARLRSRRPQSMVDSHQNSMGPSAGPSSGNGTTSSAPRRRHSLSRSARRLTLSRLFGR